MIFRRNNEGAHLMDVTKIFKEKVNKLADSSTVVVVDMFGQALIRCGEDGCCMCSRDSCTTDGSC
jgi:hypothetical protein